MGIVCPARRHNAEAGERCHLVSCPRLPYGGEVLPALTACLLYTYIAALQAALDAAKTEAAAAKTSAEEAVKKANDLSLIHL